MTDATIVDDYIARYSRWGMWGEDDQIGAMNLVGADQVRAAAALVRDGKVISLTLPYDQQGPQPPTTVRTDSTCKRGRCIASLLAATYSPL